MGGKYNVALKELRRYMFILIHVTSVRFPWPSLSSVLRYKFALQNMTYTDIAGDVRNYGQ